MVKVGMIRFFRASNICKKFLLVTTQKAHLVQKIQGVI